ncbi:MAG: hypothetical protein RM368_16070 [Nostoc sp. DedSLP03]|nr:hypothetical protein [Nostoc sp. DedSLP03]
MLRLCKDLGVSENPTPEQSALLKVTMEGRKLAYPARYSQEKLFGLYRVKWHLDTALEILGML